MSGDEVKEEERDKNRLKFDPAQTLDSHLKKMSQKLSCSSFTGSKQMSLSVFDSLGLAKMEEIKELKSLDDSNCIKSMNSLESDEPSM